MSRFSTKPMVFLILTILAVVFGLIGIQTQTRFLEDLWSQLFWLTIGVIVTTFVLETILDQDAVARSREEDAFAFRSFSANMLAALMDLGGVPPDKSHDPLEAALISKERFAVVAEHVAQAISSVSSVRPDVYNRINSDMANGLRDLGRGYIRLFASSRQEMLETYRQLHELANKWNYKDELSTGYYETTEGYLVGDPERAKRDNRIANARKEVQELMSSTARYLSMLARRVATYRGMPPSP